MMVTDFSMVYSILCNTKDVPWIWDTRALVIDDEILVATFINDLSYLEQFELYVINRI